ncbi:DNA polymerase III subunit alpha [Ureaplasma sp. ES3154-GEN]|uniref:DNA polymerase III subunit alpha n=1 Tax=Ureaplasma sp. ES3154-GEN TaxID=2984844 RepID=UPI0021E9061B|nr:DNA polymerase III subunit alpha [Ureaplasma sp. ES3154-GEN]MCV3743315.1 DNA polymerase III subunit alpha [Ureaplasma sp. ES3154-GEN]
MPNNILMQLIPQLPKYLHDKLPAYTVKKTSQKQLLVRFSDFVNFTILDQISQYKVHSHISDFKLFFINYFRDVNDYQNLLDYIFEKNQWNNRIYLELTVDEPNLVLKTSLKIQLAFLEEFKQNLINDFQACGCFFKDLVFVFDDQSSMINQIENEQASTTNNLIQQLHSYQEPTIAFNNYENQSNWNRYNKNDAKTFVKLIDVNMDMNSASVHGRIFQIEKKERSNKDVVMNIFIQDETETLSVSYYVSMNNKFKDHFLSLKEGDHIGVFGDVTNTFNDLTKTIPMIKAKKLWKINEELNLGNKQNIKPRIELGFHTKMTSSDCIIGTEDLIDFAVEHKIPCIGISDRYVVQAYPEIQTYLKKQKISSDTLKIVYGFESELLPERIDAVINPQDLNFENREYIVFDLETTGLYPNYDEIIEFGGVLVKNGQVLERKQFFLKPTQPLKQTTINLTKITNDHVINAVDEKTGLKQMLDWFQDRILVAHNAINFDINFINIRLNKYNLPPLKNMYIDTLMLSRSLNPGFRSHRLGAICKKNGISYEDDIAHRADYDAEVLVHVFNIMLSQLINEHHINNWKEVNDAIQNRSLRNRFFGDQITIYTKNQTGIKNIYELVSLSHTTYFNNRPTLTRELIAPFRENLLLTNAVYDNELINSLFNKNDDDIIKEINYYDFITLPSVNCFKNQIHNEKLTFNDLHNALNKLVFLAKQTNKPIVASSHVYYLQADYKKYYDVYVKSKGLNGRAHRFGNESYVPDLHYLDYDEFANELSYLIDQKDKYEILNNNFQIILDQIDFSIKPLKDELFTPKIENVDQKTTDFVYQTAKRKYGDHLPEIVQARIEKELKSIITHGFSVVYWISHLLVKKSNDDGYTVGSRGSVGSSLVATFLNITDVNPLAPHYLCPECKHCEFVLEAEDGYDLPHKLCPRCNHVLDREGHNIPFETFLGFDGDKVPDIDLNFSGVYQPQAHQFIKEVFGETHSYRAGTISKLKSKTSYAMVKKYFEQKTDDVIRDSTINLYVKQCYATKKTTGQHPGGIIIVPDDLSIYDFTPYNYPADDENESWKTTHFAFEYIHDNLLKFDILGHDNPTILKILEDLTHIKQDDVPVSDEKTMRMFYDIGAMGIKPEDVLDEKTGAISIPEFGTSFVRQMLVATQPRSFADLIRISGLSHGTNVYLNNAQSLIINENKKLKDVIACRDDIMSYLINHGIDFKTSFFIMEDVRKGKKIKPEHEQILRDNNIPDWYIDSANKIEYMFPKAHATAYVMHAWKFAWYKLYYPLQYYAAFLTVRNQNFDLQVLGKSRNEVVELYKSIKRNKNATNKELDSLTTYEIIIELLARGITLTSIDVNQSHATDFLIDVKTNALIPPLICIPSLGEKVAWSIMQERDKKTFTTIDDLVERTMINKRQIETLKQIGSLSDFNESAQTELF